MKTLTPKQPNYDEMKRRLRGARLKKIIDFKDKISKKNNSKSILEGSVNKDRKLVQITYDHRKCLIIKDKLKKKLKFDKLPTANFLM